MIKIGEHRIDTRTLRTGIVVSVCESCVVMLMDEDGKRKRVPFDNCGRNNGRYTKRREEIKQENAFEKLKELARKVNAVSDTSGRAAANT